jgi:hypothetical protein
MGITSFCSLVDLGKDDKLMYPADAIGKNGKNGKNEKNRKNSHIVDRKNTNNIKSGRS